jgi:hypothetical protein
VDIFHKTITLIFSTCLASENPQIQIQAMPDIIAIHKISEPFYGAKVLFQQIYLPDSEKPVNRHAMTTRITHQLDSKHFVNARLLSRTLKVVFIATQIFWSSPSAYIKSQQFSL